MSAATVALTPLKAAVGGGRTMLPGAEAVSIHGQAHGASGLAPLQASFKKNFIQPFAFGLGFYSTGARHHHGLFHLGRHAPTRQHLRAGTHTFDACVGARADKHPADLDTSNGLASLQT